MNCQKCRQPLKLDGSLEDLNPAAYDLLTGTTAGAIYQQTFQRNTLLASTRAPHSQDQARRSLYEKVSKNGEPPTFKRHPSAQARDAAMSFIYLTESQVGHPHSAATQDGKSASKAERRSSSSQPSSQNKDATPANEMSRVNKLFDILSARSDIDHPICVECADLLVEGLQRKLDVVLKERDAYVKQLKQIQADQPSEIDLRKQQHALDLAQQKQASAMAELKELEKDKDALDEEIFALEQESQRLDKDEEIFWRERNAFATKMVAFQSERDSVNAKFSNDSDLLQKLSRSNVFNDTFCISHDGSFATINALRLGRLSTKPVDWPEINAAWGHALLLVVTVASKLRYKFQNYEPQPMGSTSRIVRYDHTSPTSSRASSRTANAQPPPPKKYVLELFSSGDMPLGLTFMHRKFDNAMVAFLELVRQLGVEVQRQTEPSGHALSLPYKIDGDKIGDVSIKLGIAQDDGWTKACKLTLTCCKFLLAHASNVSPGLRE